MMPILITAENALASASLDAITKANLSANIYTGMDNESKMAPAIICNCLSATEDFPESGVWHIKSSIIVKEMAFDTSTSSSLATTVFEKITEMTPSALAHCTSSFAVYDFFIEGTEQTQEEDAWVQKLDFEIIGSLT